jgi:hypothetical protein
MSETLNALRRANPRTRPGFTESVEAVTEAVNAQVAVADSEPRTKPRLRVFGLSAAGASLTAAAAAAAFLLVGSPGGENAAAAFERAATLTAASAERSGTAIVRITHDGELWAGTTIRWNGDDLLVNSDAPRRPKKAGSALLVVDGTLYGIEPGLGWVAMGSPKNIDPGSGTTPGEYLAALREDVGGVTLRRITDGMTGLTTSELGDGSIVYRGRVAAGLIARETGFKEGQALRVLPFGYVAHDQAADPAAPLDVAVTVGPDGVVRDVAVSWGTWVYRVAYNRLGATPAPVAPKNAPSLLELRAQARDRSDAVGRP